MAKSKKSNQMAKLSLLSTILAKQCISNTMVTLHLAESNLVVDLAKTNKSASWNDSSPSTYTASTLYIATKSPDQLKTATPSSTQPKPQQ